MNENLQNTVNEMLKNIMSTTEQVKEFAVEQIPELLQQLLLFKLLEASVEIIICSIVIALSWITFSKWSNQESDYGVWAESKVSAAIIGGGASVFATLGLVHSVLTIIKITVAPKLYLIEYAASLIK